MRDVDLSLLNFDYPSQHASSQERRKNYFIKADTFKDTSKIQRGMPPKNTLQKSMEFFYHEKSRS